MSYARDYFEQAREAVRELQSIRSKLEGLPYQTDIGGIDYSKPTIAHGTAQSGMPKVESKIDMESRYIERMDELVEIINAAYDIIYGRDRKSGLLSVPRVGGGDPKNCTCFDESGWCSPRRRG